MDENGRGFLLILRGDLVKKVKCKEGEEGGLFRPGFSGYFFFFMDILENCEMLELALLFSSQH